ncbi:hypothetical protein CMUST_13415 [Corynebacterium mustelae]|uniref:Uncharacterized protein n=1 Tax=Corynebacterium mustelae TaxID=571915 RepID=A0A0G3H737_9CORY|nr:hypothetical protein CMUST_13415 [Corynebacterium mustelae]
MPEWPFTWHRKAQNAAQNLRGLCCVSAHNGTRHATPPRPTAAHSIQCNTTTAGLAGSRADLKFARSPQHLPPFNRHGPLPVPVGNQRVDGLQLLKPRIAACRS